MLITPLQILQLQHPLQLFPSFRQRHVIHVTPLTARINFVNAPERAGCGAGVTGVNYFIRATPGGSRGCDDGRRTSPRATSPAKAPST